MAPRPEHTLTHRERRALVEGPGRVCTLNGEPARVSGWGHDFATVTQKRTGLSAEWSWPAVKRVLAADAAFKSF